MGLSSSQAVGGPGCLRRIRTRDITIWLVEHDMSAAIDVCGRSAVLNAGMKIAEGAPQEAIDDPCNRGLSRQLAR
jgi:branched-chain amino acid transport system ATP-binding protein